VSSGANIVRGRSRLEKLAVGLLYGALSVAIFGGQVVCNPANYYVGGGHDPSQMMWFLVWWPYAILHHLNPFVTKMVWPPAGVNLAWMTPIPALSLLGFPITYTLGPVVSYNVLSLLAPALSAWTAYLLCVQVTGRSWPSAAGGYLYGFSSYEIGQVLGGHLGHSMAMLPPLAVLLFLHLVRRELTRRRFIVYFTACLVAQFLISTALFATMTLFGAGALMLAWCLSDSVLRVALRRTLPCLVSGYILAAVALSPYLYYVVAFGMPHKPIWPLDYYSADLVGLVLPNRLCRLRFRIFGLDAGFLFDPWETGAYLGLPTVVLCSWYYLENRGTFICKLLTISLAAVLLAALGPRLHVAGRASVILPWAAAARLPFIKHELPGRFMLFAFLIIAVMVSIWLSRLRPAGPARVAVLLLSVLFLWPAVDNTRVDLPAFFSTGVYRRVLGRNENVLAVPFGWNGDSMLWQAHSLMYFRMAGGYLGATPSEFERWPIVDALYWSILIPDTEAQLRDFVDHYRIERLIIEESDKEPWRKVFSQFDSTPERIGGVIIYKVGRGRARSHPDTDVVQAQGRAYAGRFTEMIMAAHEYLMRGLDPARLSCAEVQHLGLLPDRGELTDTTTKAGWCHRMWLGPLEGDPVGVGLIGYEQGVKSVIGLYGRFANKIFYPYPQKASEQAPVDPNKPGTLIMTFSLSQLQRASLTAMSYQSGARSDAGEGRAGAAALAAAGSAAPTPEVKESAWSASDGAKDEAPNRAGPVIVALNGTPIPTGSTVTSVNDGGVPVIPVRRSIWQPWWSRAQANDVVVIEGSNFDTRYGIAVNIYGACRGEGTGTFAFDPGDHLFSGTRIYLKVPICPPQAAPGGVGSVVVANKGRDGRYLSKSNRVPVRLRRSD